MARAMSGREGRRVRDCERIRSEKWGRLTGKLVLEDGMVNELFAERTALVGVVQSVGETDTSATEGGSADGPALFRKRKDDLLALVMSPENQLLV